MTEWPVPAEWSLNPKKEAMRAQPDKVSLSSQSQISHGSNRRGTVFVSLWIARYAQPAVIIRTVWQKNRARSGMYTSTSLEPLRRCCGPLSIPRVTVFSFVAFLFLSLRGLWLSCVWEMLRFFVRAMPTLGAFAAVKEHGAVFASGVN